MTERAKVFVIGHLPPDLENAFLQHVRDFDAAHPGCHFEIALEVPNTSLAQAIEAMRINPSITFTEVFTRGYKGRPEVLRALPKLRGRMPPICQRMVAHGVCGRTRPCHDAGCLLLLEPGDLPEDGTDGRE